jgi:cyanophycinase-like exopeptidase
MKSLFLKICSAGAVLSSSFIVVGCGSLGQKPVVTAVAPTPRVARVERPQDLGARRFEGRQY